MYGQILAYKLTWWASYLISLCFNYLIYEKLIIFPTCLLMIHMKYTLNVSYYYCIIIIIIFMSSKQLKNYEKHKERNVLYYIYYFRILELNLYSS